MALPKTLPPAELRGFCCFLWPRQAHQQPSGTNHLWARPQAQIFSAQLLPKPGRSAAQLPKSGRAQTSPDAAAEKQGPRPSPATQLPKTKGQDPALQRSCRPLPCNAAAGNPCLFLLLPSARGKKCQVCCTAAARTYPPAQRNRQKSHAGLQPYLLQLEPKMQCSAQAQLQSAITDSQLCSHVTRCAAAQIQFGIQSLRSAVTTSDLPVSAPPHITDQICQLCAQSHSQSQITAQCSAHMS